MAINRCRPRRDLPEKLKDPDTAIHRIFFEEHGCGEDADAVLVGVCVGEDVIFEAEPELFRLVERPGLRGGIGVGEGISVGLLGGCGVAPDRVSTPHEVPAVQVVLRVDGLPSLFIVGDAGVEVPVITAVDVDELVAVDVDTGGDSKAPDGIQKDGEVCVGQFASDGSRGRCGKLQRQVEAYPVGENIAASMPTAKQPQSTCERRQGVA